MTCVLDGGDGSSDGVAKSDGGRAVKEEGKYKT